MKNSLRKNELCPLHHSYFCCGRETSKSREQSRSKRGGRDPHAVRPPRFQPAVERIEDKHNPRGFREVCNDRELRRRKAIKSEEQRDSSGRVICLLCNQPITSYRELELCHDESKGHGGGFHDDHLDNLFVGHRGCNRDQGSMSLKQFLASKREVA